MLVKTKNLAELEAIIADGLQTFIQVGQALQIVKDEKLWQADYESFEAYCQERWGFGRANAYHLIGNAQIALEVNATGVTASHVTPLRQIKDPANRQNAWQEIAAIPIEERTGIMAKNIATKYKIIEELGHNNPLTKAMLTGKITPEQAGTIALELKNATDDIFGAVTKWGCPQKGVITALEHMRYEWADELGAILQSGGLQDGRNYVRFADLAPWHIERYVKRLIAEKIRQRQATVAQQQANKVNDIILDGVDTLNIPNNGRLLYLFPEGQVDPKTMVDMLQRRGYDLFMLVATKGDPLINFSPNQQVPISRVNGVKPEPVIKMMESL